MQSKSVDLVDSESTSTYKSMNFKQISQVSDLTKADTTGNQYEAHSVAYLRHLFNEAQCLLFSCEWSFFLNQTKRNAIKDFHAKNKTLFSTALNDTLKKFEGTGQMDQVFVLKRNGGANKVIIREGVDRPVELRLPCTLIVEMTVSPEGPNMAYKIAQVSKHAIVLHFAQGDLPLPPDLRPNDIPLLREALKRVYLCVMTGGEARRAQEKFRKEFKFASSKRLLKKHCNVDFLLYINRPDPMSKHYERLLAEQKNQVDACKKEIAQKDAKIKDLKVKIEEQGAQILNLQVQMDEVFGQIKALTGKGKNTSLAKRQETGQNKNAQDRLVKNSPAPSYEHKEESKKKVLRWKKPERKQRHHRQLGTEFFKKE